MKNQAGAEWYPAIRDELLRAAPAGQRQDNNSWAFGSMGGMCRHYCTAMALLILQSPKGDAVKKQP